MLEFPKNKKCEKFRNAKFVNHHHNDDDKQFTSSEQHNPPLHFPGSRHWIPHKSAKGFITIMIMMMVIIMIIMMMIIIIGFLTNLPKVTIIVMMMIISSHHHHQHHDHEDQHHHHCGHFSFSRLALYSLGRRILLTGEFVCEQTLKLRTRVCSKKTFAIYLFHIICNVSQLSCEQTLKNENWCLL